MLTFVGGLGLYDLGGDISLKGLECVRNADTVYLEGGYTSRLMGGRMLRIWRRSSEKRSGFSAGRMSSRLLMTSLSVLCEARLRS